MESFFKDLKIVELANVLAGPAVGMFFAELGADVIKIENKRTNGDITRSWKLPNENKDDDTSAYYASVNYNKKSVLLDLTSDDDRNKAYDLIRFADIVITNYKKGDDIKLQMDYDSLRKINAEIIYASITGFGNESERTAYDIVLQAETGYMYMNGDAEHNGYKMPVAFIDVLAAHQLKEAILVALIKKLKTGKGSKVSVSLFDTAVSSLVNQASNYLMTGYNPQPIGSLHPNIAPYGETFKTHDKKQIVLAVGSDKQFNKLCEILNAQEIAANSDYTNNTNRVKNRTTLFTELQSLLIHCNSGEVMQEFLEHDTPAGIIKSVKEVFESNDLSSLILTDVTEKGTVNKRIKSVVFQMTE